MQSILQIVLEILRKKEAIILRFYIMTAVITIAALIISISFRFDFWNQHELPYDDEQIGLDDQIVINFSHVVAENTPKGLAASKFAELIEEKSNGNMIVQIYPNGILYNDKTELAALQEGDVQMIAPTISKMTEELPSWQVLDLPFLFENDEQVYEVLHGPLSEQLLKELESIHIHGLTFWHNGFKQIAAKNGPMLETSDFIGLTMRSMSSKVLIKQIQLLHADPIVTSFNDLYASIQNKNIASQENTISNIYSKGYYTMHPHITLSNHGILAYSILMNADFWNNLTAQQQQIITESIDELQRWQHDAAIKLNNENLQQLQHSDHAQLYTLTKEQRNSWVKALQPIYHYYEQQTSTNYLQQLQEELSAVQ